MINALLIVYVILSNSCATLLIKKGTLALEGKSLTDFTVYLQPSVFLYIGLATVLYASSLVVSVVGYARMDVSFFNPFIAATFILTALGGALFFGEVLSTLRLLGIAIITLGVVMVARS